MNEAIRHVKASIFGGESSSGFLKGTSLRPLIADGLSFSRVILLVSPKNNSDSDVLLERLLMIDTIAFGALSGGFDWFI
jgi:hypothetical protein